MSELSDVLVVVPAYNEAHTIDHVVRDVVDHGFACLVVDDCSADRTADIVRDSGTHVVTLPINLGVGGALRVGFRFAVEHKYRAIVQVDGDGQHLAREIRHLLDHEHAGSDMVIGSRFHGDYEMSKVRRLCIRVLSESVRRSTGLRVQDPTSGFRLIRQPLLSEFATNFPAHYLGDTFEALLVAARRGYNVAEVPVEMRSRQGGRPSADLAGLVRAMIRSSAVSLIGPSFDIDPKSS